MSALEIIIPLRNPTAVLWESIDSLAVQTDRSFSVLLSDNHSTQGADVLREAVRRLEAAAIPARVVIPPRALGRVEHWNWAHGEARADWLKPLFVGDLLFPAYVQRVLARAADRPEAKFIRCDWESRQEGRSPLAVHAPFSQESLTPAEFLKYYPGQGNWIGGPVNVAYHRLAWQLSGGYMPQLPACADLQLYVTLIVRHGLESIPEPLAAFQLHPDRFSHRIGKRRVNGLFEVWLILRQMRDQCREEGLDLPQEVIRSALWRQFKNNYWHPMKNALKERLKGRAVVPLYCL